MGHVAPITVAGTVAAALAIGGCNDLRDFRGEWTGPRVGDAAPLHVGIDLATTATLDIASVDLHELSASLTVEGVLASTPIEPIAGTGADALAGLTYDGGPLRVYLGFVPVDADGLATAMVSLYDDDRVEVRLLRGGAAKIYAIFALQR